MTVIHAHLYMRCDGCGLEQTLRVHGPVRFGASSEDDPCDGWLLSEAQDLCPSCLERSNARMEGRP